MPVHPLSTMSARPANGGAQLAGENNRGLYWSQCVRANEEKVALGASWGGRGPSGETFLERGHRDRLASRRSATANARQPVDDEAPILPLRHGRHAALAQP